MVLDDTVTDRQAQPRSLYFRLRGVERLKNQIDLFRRDADAGVLDRHGNFIIFMPGADRDHPAALEAGIRRIVQKIEKDLLDLIGDRQDLGQSVSKVQTPSKSSCD